MSDNKEFFQLLSIEIMAVLMDGDYLNDGALGSFREGSRQILDDINRVIENRIGDIPFGLVEECLRKEVMKNENRLTKWYGEMSEMTILLHREADKFIQEGAGHPWEKVRSKRALLVGNDSNERPWNRRSFAQEHQTRWARFRERELILERAKRLIEMNQKSGPIDLRKGFAGDLEEIEKQRVLDEKAREVNEEFRHQMHHDQAPD